MAKGAVGSLVERDWGLVSLKFYFVKNDVCKVFNGIKGYKFH